MLMPFFKIVFMLFRNEPIGFSFFIETMEVNLDRPRAKNTVGNKILRELRNTFEINQ